MDFRDIFRAGLVDRRNGSILKAALIKKTH
jgi:hypothetical protein